MREPAVACARSVTRIQRKGRDSKLEESLV